MFKINQELIEQIKQKALLDRVPIIEDEGLQFIVDFINDHDTYSSSHVAFLKRKYPLSINDYECVCLMNSRNHPCIFYHTT